MQALGYAARRRLRPQSEPGKKLGATLSARRKLPPCPGTDPCETIAARRGRSSPAFTLAARESTARRSRLRPWPGDARDFLNTYILKSRHYLAKRASRWFPDPRLRRRAHLTRQEAGAGEDFGFGRRARPRTRDAVRQTIRPIRAQKSAPALRAVNPLKRLKTTMRGSSEKLAWIWGWRARPLGLGATRSRVEPVRPREVGHGFAKGIIDMTPKPWRRRLE